MEIVTALFVLVSGYVC